MVTHYKFIDVLVLQPAGLRTSITVVTQSDWCAAPVNVEFGYITNTYITNREYLTNCLMYYIVLSSINVTW